jgi:hypothetical protein
MNDQFAEFFGVFVILSFGLWITFDLSTDLSTTFFSLLTFC